LGEFAAAAAFFRGSSLTLALSSIPRQAFQRGKTLSAPLFLPRLDILYSQIYSLLQEEHTVKSNSFSLDLRYIILISFLSHL